MGNQVSKDQVFAYASETHKPLVQSSGSALENTRVVCTKIMPELLLPQKPIPTQYNEEELHQITFSDFSHSSNTVIACNKRLVAVTNNIGLLFNTTKLLLCCNFLEEIPPEIGYLKHLTVLSLSKNRLKTLPDTIYHLSKLKELSLADNQLVYLPSSIGSLKNLTQLALDNNKLKTLPTELGQLSKLEHLNISYNPLTTLPAELSKLKTLMTLVTTDCPFLLTEPESESGTVLSLKELTARYIVRHNIAGIHILTHGLQVFLSTAHSCTFCKGPYFEKSISRVRFIIRNDRTIPIESRLCINHYTTEQERTALLFSPLPDTTPVDYQALTVQPRRSLLRNRSSSNTVTRVVSKTPSLPALEAQRNSNNQTLIKRLSSMSLLRSSQSMTFGEENSIHQ